MVGPRNGSIWTWVPKRVSGFMLTIIHEIYMLQVESNCWNLIILCVASMPSTLNLLLYELTLMQDFWCLSWKYYSWKVFAIWFSCLVIIFLLAKLYIIAFNHFIHLICFTIVLIKIMLVACHLRNYPCYRLPTRGRVGTKLGGAWYVSNVSIISYVPC